MKLDREYQLRILRALEEIYPKKTRLEDVLAINDDEGTPELTANAIYLEEHGLIESEKQLAVGVTYLMFSRITARGMDFLAQDGGLGAILNVQTIRLHADTLRALLIREIDQTDIPVDEKSTLRKAVEMASEEALKSTTQKLVEVALGYMPEAIAVIRTLMPSVM